jgi:hypothetical protein
VGLYDAACVGRGVSRIECIWRVRWWRVILEGEEEVEVKSRLRTGPVLRD